MQVSMIYRATLLAFLAFVALRLEVVAQPQATSSSTTKQSAIQDGWPDFLGPARNGKSLERGFASQWNDNAPPIAWQKEVGTGYSAPVISGARLYHFARYGDAERLTCVSAVSGEELWRCEYATDYSDLLGYNNGPRATPVVDGERVYTMGAEGVLQCVRADDGKTLWRIDTSKDFNVVQNFFGVGSTPLVWRDLVIANIGGSPPNSPTDVYAANGFVESNGSGVVAFDKHTGQVRWKTGDDLASYASPIAAQHEGQDIVYVFARSGLLAIDPVRGAVRAHFPWRSRRLESVNASSPVAIGSEVFISETYEVGSALVRFTGTDFEEIWTDRNRRRNRAMALHWNTPIAHDGYLYGSSGYHSPEAELRCVEWHTGKVMWSEPGMGRSSLTFVDGMLVCLSEDGTLRIVRATPDRYDERAEWELSASDGTPLLNYPAWSAPALAQGRLYVQGANRLVCLTLIKAE